MLTKDAEFALNAVEVSSSPQERFAEYLQSRGKRITQQRRALVDHVFERHDHFDADELIANLAAARPGRARSAGPPSTARSTSWSKRACCAR